MDSWIRDIPVDLWYKRIQQEIVALLIDDGPPIVTAGNYVTEGMVFQEMLPVDEWRTPMWWKDYWEACDALEIPKRKR